MIRTRISRLSLPALLTGSALLLQLGGCGEPEPAAELEAEYRGVLESEGGELAFPMHLEPGEEGWTGFVTNGADTSHFTDIRVGPDSVRFSFEHYDSHIDAEVAENGDLYGTWHRRYEQGDRIELPFHAEAGTLQRYEPTDPESTPFEGEWDAEFDSGESTYGARGVFSPSEDGTLHGTFLTETGDYRFLEGVYTDSTFVMSNFDGSFAFLFKGELQNGEQLEGDFWSRATFHASFVAEPAEGEHDRDPLVVSEPAQEQIEFEFPDTEGNTVSQEDDRYAGKPMVVYIFGSWCPNCSDQTRLMKELYQEYENTDLEVVGLAFEYTGDFDRDAEMVRNYRERFDIPWQLLVAGSSDKEDAASHLPFLDQVIAYPTTVFVHPDHSIEAVHVGFSGPGTGSYYFQEINRFNEQIDAILP